MATRAIFGPNPEDLFVKLGFASSLVPHFAFCNETGGDTFLVVVRWLPVAGKPTFFIWGAREPEFGDGRRGGGGFADIWSVELSFREDQILQCIGADESPLAFL